MLFDRRNLIYGDFGFVFSIVNKPYVLIASGDYHEGYLLEEIDLLFSSYDIYFVPAYNKAQFRRAVREALHLELPVIVLNVHRLFKVGEFNELNSIMHDLLNQSSGEVFITTAASRSRRYPPEPYISHYVRHLSDVVMYSRRARGGYVLYLVKHPFMPYMKIYLGDFNGKELPISSFLNR